MFSNIFVRTTINFSVSEAAGDQICLNKTEAHEIGPPGYLHAHPHVKNAIKVVVIR